MRKPAGANFHFIALPTNIRLMWKLMVNGYHPWLLQYGNKYGRKKFYSTAPGFLIND
jgi:hypothetical protein